MKPDESQPGEYQQISISQNSAIVNKSDNFFFVLYSFNSQSQKFEKTYDFSRHSTNLSNLEYS
jgi:hypothetical protein